MPQTPHVEKHFTASEVVRDIVIGMSDGLTVPFALAAGLSGAVNNTAVVITAGLAEIAAGSIAMGLGGYLAAKTDAEHYATERAIEVQETVEVPEREAEEVAVVFRSYGLPEETVAAVVRAISSEQKALGRFHDEVRTGPGRAQPETRQSQRLDHCRFIRSRRNDSAGAVLLHSRDSLGPDRFRDRHAVGPACVRLRQRAFHGEETVPQRMADRGCGRAGRISRIFAREALRVTLPSS